MKDDDALDMFADDFDSKENEKIKESDPKNPTDSDGFKGKSLKRINFFI